MKFKKWLNKVTKIFVVLGMVLSMCFTAGNTNTVEAWDSGIPHEFTRIKSITYPEWWKRKCPQITKQWSTYMCKYNGQWSYCLEASKKTPSSGNYAASVIENNVMVRKFLYYGFGGPNGSLFKGQALTDDGLNEEETGYLYTHVLLSLAYSGDMCGANIDDLERAGIGLKSTWSYVESLPDPSNGANFSTGDIAKFTATFDKANMIQTTNTVSFNASSNETVQLPLQSNVTIHIAGSSAQQTGGTATVWGGQSFYLTAPLENSPTDYTSGTLNSSAKGKFCALAISDGNGSNQTHGSWTQESVDSLRYSVDWLDFGWIDLVKKSANEDITNNNGCYSLEGAVYGIYSDGVQVDTITTDKNGYAKSSILPVGNYTVKEITASTGYDLDENTYNVTIVKDQTVRANSNETPGNDPIGIEIVKNDAETLGMPQGDATLEGAEFTVKYYDGYYTKDNLPEKATRTWVIQTKKREIAGKTYYITNLNDFYKVSGDDFYLDENGAVTLPLGTISIEETKAPTGYLLKGNTLNVTDTATGTTSTVEDSNYVAQVTKEFKVMAVVGDNTGGFSASNMTELNIEENAFKELFPDYNNYIKSIDIDLKDNVDLAEADEEIQKIINESGNIMLFLGSKNFYIDAMEEMKLIVSLIGGTVALILGFIGIINVINTMLTSIISRKLEFSMLESIGMTNSQSKKMILFEGMYYIILTAVLVIPLGLVASFLAPMMFPIYGGFKIGIYLVSVIVAMSIISIIMLTVPLMGYRNISKESIVERLRIAE